MNTLNPDTATGKNGKIISAESARRAQRRAKAKARAEGLPAPEFEGLSLEPKPGTAPAPVEPAPPAPTAPHETVNETGSVERVWWNRSTNSGYGYRDRIPARVLRRTEKRVRVVYAVRKPNTAAIPRSNPETWDFRETWVDEPSVAERPAEDSHTAKEAYPDF